MASLFFYGWWNAYFVALLSGSIAFNYGAAYLIGHRIFQFSIREYKAPKLLLITAISANLMLLGYFKYANFFIENLNNIAGTTAPLRDLVLPLGISFFTFTQITFLVDVYQGKVKKYSIVNYALFVTYFPHLIAGPVLHHKEMIPQFVRRSSHINWDNIAVGLSIFVLGLSKKVFIADLLATFSSPIFDAVKMGGRPMLFEAWVGALAYTLQLYFDFSGYSDMAIGLSLMFNVRLPMNFNSPYKAVSIIDFWRRWHMTLARFLRDYLYIPLGGNRKGRSRHYLNVMITMLLGGLWHGANWTFVVWGGLHGLYLVINHAWIDIKQRLHWRSGGAWPKLAAGALTFLSVVAGWVFFRADSLSSAIVMLQGMAGANGISLPSLPIILSSYAPWNAPVLAKGLLPLTKLNGARVIPTLILGLAIVWALPNVRQLFRLYRPVVEDMKDFEGSFGDAGLRSPLQKKESLSLHWQPSRRQAWITGALLAFAIMGITSISEFLYFQF